MNPIRILFVVAVFAVSAYGQAFEVASIRLNKTDSSGIENRKINIEANPGSLVMRNVTLQNAMRWAFNVHDFQISGATGWRNVDRYDIVARSAASASTNELRLMLRALLADRFGLVVRSETQERAVYVLSVDKNGHKLQPGDMKSPRDVLPNGSGLTFQNATMSDFQQFLSGYPGVDRPVVDRTGLEGAFNFSVSLMLSASPETAGGTKAALVAGGITAFADALTRVGLKLEPQKIPIESIVIEKAEKPSEN